MSITLTPKNNQKPNGGGITLSGNTSPSGAPTLDQVNSFATKRQQQIQPQKNVPQKIGDYFTGGIQTFGTTIGQSLAAPKNAKLYVDSLKDWNDIDLKLRSRIQTMKKAGLDTSKLQATLQQHQSSKPTLEQFTGDVINDTTGQVLGQAAGAALDVAGADFGGGAIEDIGNIAREDLVKQGAKSGAKLGSFFGGASGLSSSLENKQSFGKTVENTALGAVAGAATGGALGAGTGKLGQFFTPRSSSEILDKTVQAVSEDFTPTKANKAGVQNENPSGILGTIKRKYTDAEKSIAQTIQKIKGYSPYKTFTEQKNTITQGIKDYANNVVKPFLAKNPIEFHAGDFEKYMENNVVPSTRFKNNPKASNTYKDVLTKGINLVEDAIKNTMKKGSGYGGSPFSMTDFNSIWDSAKAFDSAAEKEKLETTENSDGRLGVETAVQDFHTAMRDFIADSLKNKGNIASVNRMTEFLNTLKEKGIDVPNTDEAQKILEKQFGITKDSASSAKAAFFKHAMQEFRNMYDAVDNLGIKSAKEQGTTKLNRFAKANPNTVKVAKTLGTLGLGAAGWEGLKKLF